MIKGTVFDIKEMTVHDGPGSRVTVFLKGCPLRCLWCHNPEGLSPEPQLMIKENLCEKCGLCMRGCTHAECQPFERCLHSCPKGLVTLAGVEYEPKQLAEKLLKYKDFLNSVGGGITFSGGEPLLQAEFVLQTLKHIKGIHIALQTSGYCESDVFKEVLKKVDYVLYDIKLADTDEHLKYTGVDNHLILENYKILAKKCLPHVVRIPLIPGITDTPENLSAIAEIVGDTRVEIMRYNHFAPSKYKMVGLEFELPDLPSNDVDLSVFKNAVML
ncbi:MAG: glycyl-radical enzyme activating protein [Clostridia bacterium]|nr:glycyl-radical enzyme activating protein [Clostridia bacterium]